jgi:RNA methyltransferase, TrmH family
VTVTSLKDPRVAPARRLDTRAGRAAAGRCLLSGAALLEHALECGAALETAFRSERETPGRLGTLLERTGVPCLAVGEGVLRHLGGGGHVPAWLAVARLPAEQAGDDLGDFAVVLDGVADPGNLGTIVRSALALGATALVLTDAETDLFSRRALDASRGAALVARTRRYASPAEAAAALRRAGYQLVATSPRGGTVQSLARLAPGRLALLVGGESEGLGETLLGQADLVVQIPMPGLAESLNVAVAAGISIYELQLRMVLAMLRDRVRSTLGRDLNVAHRLGRLALDHRLRAVGELGAEQLVTLMVVTSDRVTPAERLRSELGLLPEELRAVTDPLEAAGLLVAADAGGAPGLAITERGEDVLARLWPVHQRTEAELLAGLSGEEQALLRRALRVVQDNAARIADDPA